MTQPSTLPAMSNPSHWAWQAIAITGMILTITWIVLLARIPKSPARGQPWTPSDRRRALLLSIAICATVLFFGVFTAQRSLLKMREDAIETISLPGTPITETVHRIGPFVTGYHLVTVPPPSPDGAARVRVYDVALGPADYIAPFIACAFYLALAWIIRGITILIRRRRASPPLALTRSP